MEEPKLSPFAPTKGRIVLLVLGAVLVLIAISMSRGGMSGYQELREANTAAKEAEAAEPAATTTSP
jgi:hypothetical protein